MHTMTNVPDVVGKSPVMSSVVQSEATNHKYYNNIVLYPGPIIIYNMEQLGPGVHDEKTKERGGARHDHALD